MQLEEVSEGLLLLTNDGDLCNQIARAKNRHEKEYIVTVDHPVTEGFLKGMEQGVRIYNPNREEWVRTRPCLVKKRGVCTFSIVLTQGYNRQIRRMCEFFSYHVVELKRVRVLNIELGDMQPGDIRKLTEEEMIELRRRVKI